MSLCVYARQSNCYSGVGLGPRTIRRCPPVSYVRAREVEMAYKETFWMACDSTEQLRAEYGPFHTRAEAESEARNLGFGYLLRYEHLLGEDEEIQEVRCIFIELPGAVPVGVEAVPTSLHTRCATCGESSTHEKGWQAE